MRSGMIALRRVFAAILLLAYQSSVLAALAGDVAVNQWLEFPNSKMEVAFPGAGAIMLAWGGGVYDSGRDQLVVWGGGHNDYSGNEVYAFGPLTGVSPAWKRLTNPSNPPANNTRFAPDGRPVSRHSGAVLDYMPAPFNKMISCGIPGQYSNGGSAAGVDLFDFTINGMTGEPWSVGATPPSTEYATGATCAYNPATQRVWFQDAGSSRNRLQQYNPITNTWTAHAYNQPIGSTVAAIDPTRNLFVWLEAGLGVRVFDLNNPDALPYTPITSGVANPQTALAPGFVYDPVNDRFVSWHGGTTLYSLSIPSNPKTGTWTWAIIPLDAGNTVTPSGPTMSGSGYETGTYGRFRYVPSLHGVVVVSATDQSVYFRKLNGTAGSPVPSVTLSASAVSVASGGSSTLTWSSTSATACTASGAWTGTKATSGSETIASITSIGTYSLGCTGAGGTGNSSVTITLSTTPAPTLTLSASPNSVTVGTTSTLNWSTTNATLCTASDAWSGAKGVSGPQTTSALSATSLFTLTCTGNGGSISQSTTVAVSAATPTPTVSISANPSSVLTNGSSTLTWSSTDASTCTASGAWTGAKATFGNVTLSPLTTSGIYTLNCVGTGGSNATQSASISVGASVSPGSITTVQLKNLTITPRTNSVVTFGHYFRAGDVPSGSTVSATNGSGATVELQVDKKSTHADGSLRHAILTAKIPSFLGSGGEILTLSSVASSSGSTSVALSQLLATTFDSQISLNVGGTVYSASARTLLSSGTPQVWLSGPLVSEWIVGAPVKTAAGAAHDHLTAYFHVRAYAGSPITQVRVDAVVENNWSQVLGANAFTYVPSVTVGTSTIYNNGGVSLTQYHHTRWHQTGWWNNTDPQIFVQHNTRYLRDTKAVPNYASITLQESVLNSYRQSITPMSIADLPPYWPGTGYSSQIGMMPEWYASYIISGDIRTYNGVLANDSAGGSYSYHYRDEKTGLVPSIDTYPTLAEGFPETGLVPGAGGNPNTSDTAHSPLVGYLGYVLTGDYYYLEELQFLANYNFLSMNYAYRQYEKGVMYGQNRAMAWGMRTIAAAAAITPDSSPLKSYFVNKLNNDFDDKAVKWSLPPTNNLGAIQDYAWVPPSSMYYAPWQNNFFVAAVNWAVELGFNSPNALSLRNWFNKWPTGLMGQDNSGYCPYYAGAYNLSAGIVDSTNTYRSFLQLYQAQYPVESAQPCPTTGVMRNGYPESFAGYYSNMQPALAMAVDAGTATLATWNKFVSLGTADYSGGPVWGIVPRPATGSLPSPSITLTANPSSVVSGTGTSLTWIALNASGCSATWTASQAASGSQSITNITSTTDYAMTCTGTGGSATSSVKVTIVPPPPTVTLTASPVNIMLGGSSTLGWTSSNATNCTAPWVTAPGISGTKAIANITITATYSMTCSGLGGTTTSSVAVNVIPAPTISFSASASLVVYNGSVTLTWSSTNATLCTGWGSNKSLAGSELRNNLVASMTFTLDCTGLGGTLSKSVLVNVEPSVSLTASPLTVAYNTSSALSWNSQNATGCVGSGSWSVNATSGSQSTGPLTGSKTYTITCTGTGGSKSATVDVIVTPPPPGAATVSLTANPTTVISGSATTLTWSTTNATACSATGSWSGAKAVSGTETSASLTAGSNTFTLSCNDSTGKAITANATVIVISMPIITFSASPTNVAYNGSTTLTWSTSNSTACTASGSWSGNKSLSGTETVNALTSDGTFAMNCSGSGGTTEASVNVTVAATVDPLPGVNPTPVPTSPTDNSAETTKVGGGVIDPLLVGGMLLLWVGLRRARAVRILYRG